MSTTLLSWHACVPGFTPILWLYITETSFPGSSPGPNNSHNTQGTPRAPCPSSERPASLNLLTAEALSILTVSGLQPACSSTQLRGDLSGACLSYTPPSWCTGLILISFLSHCLQQLYSPRKLWSRKTEAQSILLILGAISSIRGLCTTSTGFEGLPSEQASQAANLPSGLLSRPDPASHRNTYFQ